MPPRLRTRQKEPAKASTSTTVRKPNKRIPPPKITKRTRSKPKKTITRKVHKQQEREQEQEQQNENESNDDSNPDTSQDEIETSKANTKSSKSTAPTKDELSNLESDPLILKTYTKNIPEKRIATLWEPLSSQSIETVINTLNLFVPPSTRQIKQTKRKHEAQQLLSNLVNQLQTQLENAQLPPGLKPQNYQLDYVSRQKAHLENVLNSDLRQVAELELEIKRQKALVKSDEEFLKELSKNSRQHQNTMSTQEKKIMAQLKDSISDSHRHDTSEDVHLINRESKVYKQEEDAELQNVLESLSHHINTIKGNVEVSKTLTESCKRIYLE